MEFERLMHFAFGVFFYYCTDELFTNDTPLTQPRHKTKEERANKIKDMGRNG
jgi:hypothetical protein